MPSIRLSLPSVLLAMACLVLTGLLVAANRSPGMPTVVVTVNVSKVLDGLDERSLREAEYKKLATKVKDENDAKQAELEAMDKQLKELPEADVEARRAVRSKLELAKLDHSAWHR